MHTPAAVRKFFILVLLATLAIHSAAAGIPTLEDGLLHALRLKPGSTQRAGNSGNAIRAYVQQGYVDKKPNQRVDYTDYYLLHKPAKLMGHDLVVIEEEYQSAYVGCCVSPGIGVTLKIVGEIQPLQTFARTNRCTLTEHMNIEDKLLHVNIRASFPAGNFATLSCRERDAES